MPRHVVDDEDWADDGDEWEADAADDDDSDAEGSIVSCPYCKRPIPEDTPRCPYCENYISEEDAPAPQKPWWLMIGAAVCLYIIYRWTVG
jgi:hypothetical protein